VRELASRFLLYMHVSEVLESDKTPSSLVYHMGFIVGLTDEGLPT
jgi:hypothetical protein